MTEEDKYRTEIEVQKKIVYTAGLLQGDITVKTLLESLAEGIVIVNETGRIVLINSRLAEMTGYSKREVVGETINIFLPEDRKGKHLKHVASYFSKPNVRPMGIGMELEARRKDGSTFPVEISLSSVEVEDERLALAFMSDITVRKKIDRELKQKNRELDAYAHTVAHDLNSLLTGIIGFSELLIDRRDTLGKDKQLFYLQQVARGARKMGNIIRELLLFASMKKEDIELIDVDMVNLIESACLRLRYLIEEKDVQFIMPDKLISSKGYPSWIEEVWFNYISNAIKYGGEKPKVEISSKYEGDYVKYTVKDSGDGLENDLLKVVFDERGDVKDRLTKGLGLGLSIVKSIIEKLDGHVDVNSEKGKGSEFSFYLKK